MENHSREYVDEVSFLILESRLGLQSLKIYTETQSQIIQTSSSFLLCLLHSKLVSSSFQFSF